MGEHKYQAAHGKPSVVESSNIDILFKQLSIDLDDLDLPRFFRKNTSDLRSFRSLKRGQSIVLFTPAVKNPTGENMDPFEPLGRALCDYHSGVKHVPYTRTGFTLLHKELVHQADAVVFVLAEPKPERNPPSSGSPEPGESIRKQLKFGNVLLSQLKELETSVPLVVVVCADMGNVRESSSSSKGPHAFGTVVQANDFDDKTLKDVARAIFFKE